MTNLKETAEKYEAPKIKSISELPSVSVDSEVAEELDVEYPYKYILVNGERYKVNNSVLADLKEHLVANPALKAFKVIKKGEGMKTKYTVIPLN